MVLFSSDSLDSSGYDSVRSKFGSTSSTPSVMLPSQLNNSEKASKTDLPEEKNRSRSVSLSSVYFLVFGYEKQQAISTETAVYEQEMCRWLLMSHTGHFTL